MNISTSILLAGVTAAAVGAARIVQETRHQRQRNETVLAGHQIEWLSQVSANADLAEMWAPVGVEARAYQEYMTANRMFCQLSLRNRLGFVTERQLPFHASALMNVEACRRYWARFAAVREEEAIGDEVAEKFNAAMHIAFHAHDQTQSASASAAR
ncbi:DUF6082 family protein [Streptomyces anulatus]|uniref:DUF6082 family protein n=1 Tax=Streptomyces anulatus TaxID=1892 RepID=UPI0033EA08F6